MAATRRSNGATAGRVPHPAAPRAPLCFARPSRQCERLGLRWRGLPPVALHGCLAVEGELADVGQSDGIGALQALAGKLPSNIFEKNC